MKVISVLRGVNNILLIINVLLYCTVLLVFCGALFQIILGGYQVLTAIILLFFWTNYNKEEKIKLLVYWLFLISYGFAWYFELLDKTRYEVFTVFILPMCVAIVFTVFLEGLANKYKKVL